MPYMSGKIFRREDLHIYKDHSFLLFCLNDDRLTFLFGLVLLFRSELKVIIRILVILGHMRIVESIIKRSIIECFQ